MQLDKFFDFLKDEKNLYAQWEKSNCFKPQKGGEPYSIMMPPPNVTGSLHMACFDLHNSRYINQIP